jgi:hypothetical protein
MCDDRGSAFLIHLFVVMIMVMIEAIVIYCID